MKSFWQVANRQSNILMNYRHFLTNYYSLSELLYLPLPSLPTASQKSDSILIGSNAGNLNGDSDEIMATGGKWEDEEERRFFEDVQDLKDFVPSSVLGVEEPDEASKDVERDRAEKEKEEVRKLEEELEKLNDTEPNGELKSEQEEEEECVEFPFYRK
jgi:regulator of nonsense transcripts 2